MSEKDNHNTFLAFILGGVIGAILGILFAPRSGKETREKLGILFEDLSEKAENILEEGKEKAEEMKEKVGNLVENIKGKFVSHQKQSSK